MPALPEFILPEHWMLQIFSAKTARQGGVVRRKVRDVERIVGREEFEAELRRRGYLAVENAGQYVIFCNRQPLYIIGAEKKIPFKEFRNALGRAFIRAPIKQK